MGRDVGNI